MKNFKTLLAITLVLLLTGCTEYKEIDNKKIENIETEQRIVDNILCKTDQTIIDNENNKQDQIDIIQTKLDNNEITNEEFNTRLSEINEVFNIDDVVKCEEFNILSGENGLWETIFVKPLSWLLLTLGGLFNSLGFAIVIVTILIRLALYPITRKTAMQSENMNAAKSKLSKLEEKYRNKSDRDSQMMKSQEMMKIYKEYNINPMSGCLYAFIQIPLFFAFLESLYRLPIIFEGTFLGINLGINPTTAISNGMWYYILIPVIVASATYFSFKLNKTTSPVGDAANQMKMMMNISVVLIAFASFTTLTGIAIYWIVNSSFTIVQNLIVKKEKKNADIL